MANTPKVIMVIWWCIGFGWEKVVKNEPAEKAQPERHLDLKKKKTLQGLPYLQNYLKPSSSTKIWQANYSLKCA